MGRQPCCDKVGLKQGPWTADEDKKLISFILTHGQCCWRALPKLAGLLRCGKSCRLRWTNYLRPDLKRGLLSEYEENMVIDLHAKLGNRWSKIASHLPGRTDNEIKNYWNTHIKKKLKKMGIDPQTHKPISELQQEQQHQQNPSSTLPISSSNTKPQEPQNSDPILSFEDCYTNIVEPIDSFSVDEVLLNEPMLTNPDPSCIASTISSSSSSSTSSSSSGYSLVFNELQNIPDFDWGYYDESHYSPSGNTLINNGTSTEGFLWDDDELSNWDLPIISDDCVEIDPLFQLINKYAESCSTEEQQTWNF